ncbi:MAG: hypothetical protein J6R95_05635, partial [Bacteroidales bacterium]|nr:hypothetical protein [Bacteroidales bacterium]
MTAIAGNIRKYGGAPQGTLLNLDQMAQGVTNVHDAGYAVGIAQGKQEQYDLFWDAFQQNGTRTDYLRAFTGYNFTINSFYPKYDINLTGYCTHAFYGWGAKSGG